MVPFISGRTQCTRDNGSRFGSPLVFGRSRSNSEVGCLGFAVW